MEKEMFISWNNYDIDNHPTKGGTFKLSISGNILSYDIISGSAIETDELIWFLWFWPGLDDVRKLASSLTRKGSWRVESRRGVLGATDWWIVYSDDFGIVRETRSVVHDSINNESNIKIKCWIKDLYDLLRHFKDNGLYKPVFENLGRFRFKDITDSMISRQEYFNVYSL